MVAAATAPTFRFFRSTIGKKYIMGISGLIWAGFVFVHMAGNMLILVGADAYNMYAHALEKTPITPIVEILLIVALIAHVSCAVSLTRQNRKARGEQKYAMTPNGDKSTYKPAQFMMVQGSIVLVFLISHLATFKYGQYYEATVQGTVMRDLHRLVIELFKQPGFVGWYIVSLALLAFHLSHGVGSTIQSLGIWNDRLESPVKKISRIYGFGVAAGFIVQPLYVYFIAG
jgi:succinate dehydrogenase / fumarate reductase cytochrome b subunit